jgi:hypothetical protein
MAATATVPKTMPRDALALPTKRRLVVLGTGRSSTAFLRRLDPALLVKGGGRLDLVVVSPRDVPEFPSQKDDVREIVMTMGGTYVQATALSASIFRDVATFESVVSKKKFDISYDSLVVGIGTKTERVPGAEGRAFCLPRDAFELMTHLRTCAYFEEISGDERYLKIAVVVPPKNAMDLGHEMAKASAFVDREFEGVGFLVSLGTSEENVRVHENYVVERPTESGGKIFERFGAVITTSLERERSDFVWNLVEQISLVDANYDTNRGILVDGLHRVVGAGNVFAIGSASLERSGVSFIGATPEEISVKQGERLAKLLSDHILVI